MLKHSLIGAALTLFALGANAQPYDYEFNYTLPCDANCTGDVTLVGTITANAAGTIAAEDLSVNYEYNSDRIAGAILSGAGFIPTPNQPTITASECELEISFVEISAVSFTVSDGVPQVLGMVNFTRPTVSDAVEVASVAFDLSLPTSDQSSDFGFDNPVVFEGLAPACSETPTEQLQGLDLFITQLVADGSISSGHGNALSNKINSAIKQIGKGNTQAAIDKLQALIDQTNSLVGAGQIDPADGQVIVDDTQAVIDALSV